VGIQAAFVGIQEVVFVLVEEDIVYRVTNREVVHWVDILVLN
jgi:hypothetical protein